MARTRESNPTGTLPAKGARQWDHVYEAALERGHTKSAAARQAWCAVKRYYYKRGERWIRRKKPLAPHESPPGCTPYRGKNPESESDTAALKTRLLQRSRNPPASPGCVLAKDAWGRPITDCGDDPGTPKEAARALARMRWALPQDQAVVKARLLRLGERQS